MTELNFFRFGGSLPIGQRDQRRGGGDDSKGGEDSKMRLVRDEGWCGWRRRRRSGVPWHLAHIQFVPSEGHLSILLTRASACVSAGQAAHALVCLLCSCAALPPASIIKPGDKTLNRNIIGCTGKKGGGGGGGGGGVGGGQWSEGECCKLSEREREKDGEGMKEEEDGEKAIYMLILPLALQLPRWVPCPLPSNKLLAGKPVAMFTQ